MKYITLVLLLSYCGMNAMELPRDQQDKNNNKNQQYTILPADICAKMAAYKSEIDGPAVKTIKMIKMSCPVGNNNALHRISATWNSLIPQSSPDERHNWWDHQFRYQKNTVGAYTFSSVLHFDTITTRDYNEFIFDKVRLEGEHPSIQFKAQFDGPNNDGGPEGGVVLVADSYFGRHDRKTRFYLFKLRGKSSTSQELPLPVYRGVLNRFKLPKDERHVRFKDQNLDFCALAPYKRGIIATHTTYYVPYLNIFEYTYDADESNRSAPHQAFRVKMLVSAQVPHRFARLAWIYGRTLLGLTHDKQLYVVALDEQKGKTSIRFCPQKTDKKITNFCLARPHNHHIVFLCDDQRNIYTVNLKHRTGKGALALNLLTRNGQKASHELERVDRMWTYEDRLALMDTLNMKVLLFTLNQKNWTVQNVNEVLQSQKVI